MLHFKLFWLVKVVLASVALEMQSFIHEILNNGDKIYLDIQAEPKYKAHE